MKTPIVTLFPSLPHPSQFDILLEAHLHDGAGDKACSPYPTQRSGLRAGGGLWPVVFLSCSSFPWKERAENWVCIPKFWIQPKISVFWRATAANKAKKTPLSQGYGFVSSDEKPHKEKWVLSRLPSCFSWSNNSSLLTDTIITESRSSAPMFERRFELCIRTDEYLKKQSTLSSQTCAIPAHVG